MRFVEFERVVSNLNRGVQHVSFRRQWYMACNHSAKRVLQKWDHLFRITQMQVRLHAGHSFWTRGPSFDHRDVPQISERISYRSLPVARDVVPDLVNRSRTCLYRPREERVCIVKVQMNGHGSRRDLLVRVSQFDNRISDRHLRMHDQLRTRFSPDAKAFRSGKRVRQKLDELARPRHNDVRRNGV